MAADADDILRETVATLSALDGSTWAGIFFVEEGELVLGPEAGTPDEARRTAVPVLWQGAKIAELAVDGDVDRPALETVAAEIAGPCLVGWDTGGEPWQP
ncbi:MAG: hypothetical protein ACYDCH_02275 [Gaiellaceae bacterium]